MEEQKLDKTEARKKLNKVCFRCFILDIILVSLIIFFSLLLGVFELGTAICFVLVLVLFFAPFVYAIKSKVFSLDLLLNLFITVIIIFLLAISSISCCGAQDAAKAARIKSAIDQFRSNAEIYKLRNGNYGAPINMKVLAGEAGCVSVPDSIVSRDIDGSYLCEDIQSQRGGGELRIYSNSSAYCIQKILPGTPAVKWCLDSEGNVGSILAKCNSVNFSCKE